MEIKAAIERLPPNERAELDALIWPHLEANRVEEAGTPPRVREKLAMAAAGRFLPGDRGNIEKVLAQVQVCVLH
jgi:hypothetical protein